MIQHPTFGWLPHECKHGPIFDLSDALDNYIYYHKNRENWSEAEILDMLTQYVFLHARRIFHDQE